MPAYISSIGTANPPTKVDQKRIADFMIRHLPLSYRGKKVIQVLYRAIGIRYRHSVLEDFEKETKDFSFFPGSEDLEPFPPVSKRMELYEQEAPKLGLAAAKNCLNGFDPKKITHLITVSCTGMYAPGLDIEIVERLGLATDVQRTSINFMGCYASFNAMKVANEIACNHPEANILTVSVELCSIHLLKNTDEESLLSNALFGDGAAALLVQGQPNGKRQFRMEGFYSDLSLDGKEEMAWHISDFGFQMKLSAHVPDVIRRGIGKLTQRLLSRFSLSVSEINHFAIHPGGKKILEVIETELGLTKAQNEPAYRILRDYGNMSSPTVLFVMKEIFQQLTEQNRDEKVLSFAFGPGLTLESMLLKVI